MTALRRLGEDHLKSVFSILYYTPHAPLSVLEILCCGCTVMGNLPARAFLLPGNTVCSYFGVTDPEGRMMLRTLINMLVWNVVAVVGVVLWFG